MRPAVLTTSIILGATAVISLIQAQSVDILELKDQTTIIVDATNVLMVFLVIAVAIERGCEGVMETITAAGLIPAKPADGTSDPEISNARALVGNMLCLSFAAAISLFGLRLVEMVLESATDTSIDASKGTAFVDALLTALILAGGSNGIHKMIKSFQSSGQPA
jgi:hypothetical protein